MDEVTKHTAKLWSRTSGAVRTFLFWCPGCGHAHTVPTPHWNFTGSFDRPSLAPSVRHFVEHPDTKAQQTTCHYHLTDGKLIYCSDSPHALAGQTVGMVEISPDYGFN